MATIDALTFKHMIEMFEAACDGDVDMRLMLEYNTLGGSVVDPSNVMMASVKVDDVVCNGFTSGINTSALLESIGSPKKSDGITAILGCKVSADKQCLNQLTVDMDMSFITPSVAEGWCRKEPKVPDLSECHCNHVTISPKVLLDVLKRTYGEYVHLGVSDDAFEVTCEDDENGSSKFTTQLGISKHSTGTRSLFDKASLIRVMKVLKKCCDTVTLEFGNDYPIFVKGVFGKDYKASVSFLLAPRINSE